MLFGRLHLEAAAMEAAGALARPSEPLPAELELFIVIATCHYGLLVSLLF